jgi:hypothetical protein
MLEELLWFQLLDVHFPGVEEIGGECGRAAFSKTDSEKP